MNPYELSIHAVLFCIVEAVFSDPLLENHLTDKHGYRTFFDAFIAALVQIGRMDKVDDLPEGMPLWKTTGALYIHYLKNDQVTKKNEILDAHKNQGALIQYGIIPQLLDIKEFELAESYVERTIHKPATYRRLYEAKIGKSRAQQSYEYGIKAYRSYRERLN